MKNLFYLLSLLVITFACFYQKPENEEIKFINNAVGKAKVANNALCKHFNLEYQSSGIIMDKNGNEIDRAVNYDGNMALKRNLPGTS